MDVASLAAGLGVGLSLIVAIGAQNAFVLRQGIRREHVFAVAAVCAASDLVLIAAGVSGIGAVLHAVPWLIAAVRWVGAVFLVVYGALAGWRALRPSGESLVAANGNGAAESGGPAGSGAAAGATAAPVTTTAVASTRLWPTLATCLALTWLNPHVYLDTVFLLGSVANTHGDPGRWWFAAGAGVASILWFFGLAYGARLLGRVLATHTAWRILDGLIAVVMIALGLGLALSH